MANVQTAVEIHRHSRFRLSIAQALRCVCICEYTSNGGERRSVLFCTPIVPTPLCVRNECTSHGWGYQNNRLRFSIQKTVCDSYEHTNKIENRLNEWHGSACRVLSVSCVRSVRFSTERATPIQREWEMAATKHTVCVCASTESQSAIYCTMNAFTLFTTVL